jgi:hypothetical protein
MHKLLDGNKRMKNIRSFQSTDVTNLQLNELSRRLDCSYSYAIRMAIQEHYTKVCGSKRQAKGIKYHG